ncbi:S8 family serine peptidase [Xylella fastidiosa subsp. multiplex]|uniref:S8 family serine peptidase n=1 Tax=Xylella fastidiosa TaxID=2371 RepID=UPI00234DFC5C|nr:S8 family serine peptidase [Xylella fastidiosa]MDC6412279.1 S8 family serine peptidase [Xylella fastidiosa subsp. multiplex]MDD0862990.1 S8 family serine peptidase [Xylella fastidiosa subsp. multiplex]WDN63128.1 S8 family serine peptidase [Xylella fastidiosa subsp. multiplex]WDN64699.1 S8 family serine peptidase [Xylella fastidiosa subsp. multiplex]
MPDLDPALAAKFRAHLDVTNTEPAHTLGFTGKGYMIGVVDSGVNPDHVTLQGRVIRNNVYVDYQDPSSPHDVDGHGTTVAQLAAGRPFGDFPGGIAPGATIFSARVFSSAAESAKEDPIGGNFFEGEAAQLKRVNADMIAAGVRIQNNSWGYESDDSNGEPIWTSPIITGLFVNAYRDLVLNNNGLMIFASGNGKQTQPGQLSRLPSLPTVEGGASPADLERGWLVVAALDSFDHPDQLASYSNHCGIAMHYCLAAPGDVITVNSSVTNSSSVSDKYYVEQGGTSFAAPLVSGAAALVWEAFPYFSNDLVRQTLLGTATDLGAPGVDEVFGYGALNVGKAVLGPAKFDWGDVQVSFDDRRSTWGNDITGSGGLIKRGTGTLMLGGSNNQYTGATQVLGGTLQASSLGASAVSVANTATLIGSGRFGGAVSNAGTLELGKDGLKVQGDYTQLETGRLALYVGDQLSVAGNATLKGGELQVLGKRDYVTFNTSYSVLQADGSLTGTFSQLTWGPAVLLGEGRLTYGANNAYVTLQRLNVSAAAQALGIVDRVAQASAQRVEQAFRAIDAQQAQGRGALPTSFIGAAAALQQSSSAAVAAGSLQSLSGQSHVAAAAASLDAIDLGRRSLATRLDVLRSGERIVTWHQALGGPGQNGAASGTFSLSGWLVGHDAQLASGDIVGVAFGQADSSPSGSASGLRGIDRQVQGRVYLQRTQGPLYVLGQLGFGSFQRRLDRQLQLGDWNDWTSSRYSGQFWSGSVEAGYHWRQGSLALTPYLGLDQTQLRTDGFREQSGSGFGLQVQSAQATRSQLLAGVRTEWRWGGVQWRGYGEWQQTLRQSGLNPQASFTATSSWTPLVASSWPGRSGGVLGLSMVLPVGVTAGLWTMGLEHYFGTRSRGESLGLRYQLGF